MYSNRWYVSICNNTILKCIFFRMQFNTKMISIFMHKIQNEYKIRNSLPLYILNQLLCIYIFAGIDFRKSSRKLVSKEVFLNKKSLHEKIFKNIGIYVKHISKRESRMYFHYTCDILTYLEERNGIHMPSIWFEKKLQQNIFCIYILHFLPKWKSFYTSGIFWIYPFSRFSSSTRDNLLRFCGMYGLLWIIFRYFFCCFFQFFISFYKKKIRNILEIFHRK